MPFEYLREIALATLPLVVEEEECIDKLRVLRAANLVTVVLPHPHSERQYARILAITPRGQEMLETECEPMQPSSDRVFDS